MPEFTWKIHKCDGLKIKFYETYLLSVTKALCDYNISRCWISCKESKNVEVGWNLKKEVMNLVLPHSHLDGIFLIRTFSKLWI